MSARASPPSSPTAATTQRGAATTQRGAALPRFGIVILIVATAWAFLPIDALPTFDSQKTVVALGITALLTLTAFRRRSPARDLDILVVVPILLALTAWGVVTSAAPAGSLEGPLLAVAALLSMRLVAGDTDPACAVRAVARGAAIAAAGAGLYAVLQWAGLDPAPWGERRQVVATFGNTSFAASFQAAALPLALFLTLAPRRYPADAVLGMFAAALGALHLALARSRIDFAAAAAGIAVLAVGFLCIRGRRRVAAIVGGGATVCALAASALFLAAANGGGPAWLGRSDTVTVRAHIWSSFRALVPDAPLWLPQGRAFVDLFPGVRSPEEFAISLGRTVDTPHNDVLGLTVTLGVVGTVIALALATALFRRLVRRGDLGHERTALVAALAALFVSALASSPLTHGATAVLGGALWGAAIAVCPAPRAEGTGESRLAHGLALALLLVALWPATHILRSDGFLASGRQALAAGELEETLLAMEAAAAADHRAFEPRAEIGGVLLNAGEPEAAVKALRSAVRVRPGDPVARSNLARALLVGGDATGAAAELRDALAIVPWHPELLATRAHIALADGRGADAATDLEAAAALSPHEPRMDALLAEARLLASPGGAAHEGALAALALLLERRDLAQVRRSVPSMIRRDPTFIAALAAAARRWADEGATADAALLVLAAARTSAGADDPGFLQDAARVLSAAGDDAGATAFTGRALGLLAARSLARGDLELAVRQAKKAVDRDQDPEHWLVLARALARLGQHDAAIDAVGAAVATGPIDARSVAAEPDLSPVARDERLILILKRAAQRAGEEP